MKKGRYTEVRSSNGTMDFVTVPGGRNDEKRSKRLQDPMTITSTAASGADGGGPGQLLLEQGGSSDIAAASDGDKMTRSYQAAGIK
jgi:hypothetical protein